MSLRGKTVLVTGATGFIGGRLVEKLILQHGAKVRALVRDYRRAIRIGRFDIEFVHADITDVDALRDADERVAHELERLGTEVVVVDGGVGRGEEPPPPEEPARPVLLLPASSAPATNCRLW